VTIVQTVLVYVVIPAAVLVLFAALTMWPKPKQNPRYRSGEGWDYPPVWWSANPAGVERHPEALGSRALGAHGLGSSGTQLAAAEDANVVGGGARGTW
jgi:hypothetical protein